MHSHEAHPPFFAIVTPFDKHGAVDEEALGRYLEWLWERGVRQIVAGGTTGEFASLTLAERRRLLETCRASFAGEVFAHVSSSSVGETRELIGRARDFADGILLLPPFYYANAAEAGVREFFIRAAADSPLPLYLYNFPRHTQFNILPEMFAGLSHDLRSLRGIKDSGGKWEQSLAYKRMAPEMQVVVGADNAALKALENGLDGSVTGGANPVPRLLVRLEEQWRAGNLVAAQELQTCLDRWTAARKASAAHEIAIIKSTLAELLPGFAATVRPPLIEADPQIGKRLGTLVREIDGV
jgi:dihydrodipicolinate synthase/N-acetylneuraminate lyase